MLKVPRTLAMASLILAGPTLLQQVALADVPSVQMTLIGVNGANLGGVYTSPYEFNLGTDTSNKYWLVCDDFTTDISIGLSWTAETYALSGVMDGGPQKFPSIAFPAASVTYPGAQTPTAYTIQQRYDAAAWLAEQLLTSYDSGTAGYYSYAIWQIFDPTAVYGYGGQTLDQYSQGQVATLMRDALGANYNESPPQLYLYVPQPYAASQEFIGLALPPGVSSVRSVSVPEGPTPTLLALDFLALASIVLFARRRNKCCHPKKWE